MVIDSSALVAILQNRFERRSFNQATEPGNRRAMSLASIVEVSMIIKSRFDPDGIRGHDTPREPK